MALIARGVLVWFNLIHDAAVDFLEGFLDDALALSVVQESGQLQ